jgi:glycerol kinase
MILAIDQGTTGTTCIVFDDEGRPRGRGYSEFEQHFPRPGWVEHDAAEIWEVTRKVAIAALADAGVQGSDLAGVGITNQRETVVAWDPRSGKPVHRALVWQDRRTAARCDELREAGHEELIRERTGLVIDPYFSGTKIEWLLRHGDLPEETVFGTIDSWLAFKLTGRHLVDYSNASRTMLFDIRKLAWDDELCGLLGVDRGSLPEPVPSSEVYGTTSLFGGEVPVAGIAGDQQAALFGQACQRPGEAKNTYGTGSFVLLNTGTDAPDPGEGLLTTVAWGLAGEVDYALEAAVFVTGAAVQWLRDGLGIITEAGETEATGRLAHLERRRLLRAGAHRARLAPLGPLRPRHDRRPHPRLGQGGARPRGARIDRLPDRRRRARAGGRVWRAGAFAQGRRWRGRQQVADAVPGGRARGAGDRARGRGDDRARRRLPGGDRYRAVDGRSGA